jgi:hypothetical protein
LAKALAFPLTAIATLSHLAKFKTPETLTLAYLALRLLKRKKLQKFCRFAAVA